MSKKQKNKKSIIFTIIEIVLVIILIISLARIVMWWIENKKSEELKQQLSNSVKIEQNYVKEDYTIDFNQLNEINSDAVGWIKVYNTPIEYPVVKSNNNDFYLNHSFDKSYNTAGWIFADYRNKLDGTDKNIIIYGHNRRGNGNMFGPIAQNILTNEWNENEESGKILFITKQEKAKYQIFSAYQIYEEDYYLTTDFKDKEFVNFIKRIKSRSEYNYNVEVNENDTILTLSTCATNDNYRIVVHAKKFNI